MDQRRNNKEQGFDVDGCRVAGGLQAGGLHLVVVHGRLPDG